MAAFVHSQPHFSPTAGSRALFAAGVGLALIIMALVFATALGAP